MVLHHYGLQLEDTIFKPDFAKNSVLSQLYNGDVIKPGTKIQQGSKITLVLGNGIGGMEFMIPNLVGLSYHDAKAVLDSERIIVGAVVPDDDVTDNDNAFVYRQNPNRYDEEKRLNHIREGQTIDLWLSVKKPDRQGDSTQVIQNN